MTELAVLEPWLDKRGLAEHLSCSIRWIEKRMEDGMPHAHIAGRAKFRASEVEAWLERVGVDHGPPTDLYRCFDAEGELLYIGISLTLAERLSAHRAGAPWWPEAARIEIEHFPTRSEATAAERTAIRDEQPAHNVVHNGRVCA